MAGRRSPAVVASALASAGLLVPIVQVPAISRFFGCTPLGPVGWATAIGSASAATGVSIAVPWAASRLPGAPSQPASGTQGARSDRDPRRDQFPRVVRRTSGLAV